MLFDTEQDPYEVNNLIKPPQYKQTVKNFKDHYENFTTIISDQGKVLVTKNSQKK